jgi:hypothetical protein
MAKLALIIGVSDYEPGLTPLPGAAKDINEMQQVLQHPEVGGFDDIKMLSNPEPLVMQEAIEALFSDRAKDDLVLLFFSGHGIKDDNGKLHLATRITRKTTQGELIRATAVPSSFVQDVMSNSRSRRQVVILDCCFSGAFAEGWLAKDDGSVDVKTHLGGEGRAVLTSSTSTQYSFEQEGADLSTYTRYLVEGIRTGAADLDEDGVVSLDELHEYVKRKVQETAPMMKPEIYAIKEGYKICLSQAPIEEPKLRYRKEVEHCVSRGEITMIGRRILEDLRHSLELLPGETGAIEAEVLKPHQEYEQKLRRYEQTFVDAIQHEYPLCEDTQKKLQRHQKILGLRNEDIVPIETRIVAQKQDAQAPDGISGSIEASVISRSEDIRLEKLLDQAVTSDQSEMSVLDRIRLYQIPAFLAPILRNPKLLIGVSIASSLALGTYLGVTLSPRHPIGTSAPFASPISAYSPKTGSLDLFNRAIENQNRGNNQGAIADYTQALRINQDWGTENSTTNYYGRASAHFNRGFVHYTLREFRLAFEDFNQAIILKSDLAIAYYYRGLARNFSDADQKGALRDLMQGIAINKNWGSANPAANYFGRASAYFSLGDLNTELGNKLEAIKNYQQALALFQQKGEILNAQKAQERMIELQQR